MRLWLVALQHSVSPFFCGDEVADHTCRLSEPSQLLLHRRATIVIIRVTISRLIPKITPLWRRRLLLLIKRKETTEQATKDSPGRLLPGLDAGLTLLAGLQVSWSALDVRGVPHVDEADAGEGEHGKGHYGEDQGHDEGLVWRGLGMVC